MQDFGTRPCLERWAFLGYRGTATDTTSEVAALRKAEHLSRHDPLTGLPNRILVEKRLDRHLADHQGDEIATITLDLDRFKEINDTFGHSVGDQILVKVAERLQAIAEPGDIVGRQGGDCFVLVQVGLPQPQSSELLCDTILAGLRKPMAIAGTSIVPGASLGVALLSDTAQTAEALLRDSEVAMYRAKEDGRGVYRFHEESMSLELRRKLELEAELREAMASNKLELHFQPLLDTETLRMTGSRPCCAGRALVSPTSRPPSSFRLPRKPG